MESSESTLTYADIESSVRLSVEAGLVEMTRAALLESVDGRMPKRFDGRVVLLRITLEEYQGPAQPEAAPFALEDLVLTDPGGDPVIVHETCNSVTAGSNFVIVAGRDVTLSARNLLVLEGGFGVESGAVFHGLLDPLAGQTAGPDANR